MTTKRKIMWVSLVLFLGTLAVPGIMYSVTLPTVALAFLLNGVVFEILSQTESGKSELQKIDNSLNFLQKEMVEISEMENKVEAMVRLFKVISPIEDNGGFSQTIQKLQKKDYRMSKKLDQRISALKTLNSYFINTRNVYGFNRTKPGEEISAEKVFLGDIFGIWTLNASYWLKNQEECKKTFRPDVSKNPEKPVSTWYLINDYQAGPFVKEKTEGILKQIVILKKVA